MTLRNWLLAVLCGVAVGCSPNIVSSEVDAGPDGGEPDAGIDSGVMDAGFDAGTTDAGQPDGGFDAGEPFDAGPMDAGEPDAGPPVDAGAGPYPGPPYGVSVNRTIQNFVFPGYASAGAGVKINTLPKINNLDLQMIRNMTDPTGKRFRFLLLDISAGWCAPCNQEAQDLGLIGSKSAQVTNWLNRGGIFFTVLVQGYDQSTGAAPLPGDIDTWANQHQVQTSLALDPTQNLIAQGISPSAYPTNLVIDLRTMKIVGAWYGLDTTYQKWEAALNGL